MKLLCDEMLSRLGRSLRAAGHDTEIATGGASDTDLVARCTRDQRLLITRDRHLAAHLHGAAPVCLLAGQTLDEQAVELRRLLRLDWVAAPFSRCLVDNMPLVRAPPEFAEAMPPMSRAVGGELRQCPSCRRLYWPGGHVRRMMARLTAWSRGAAGANSGAIDGAGSPLQITNGVQNLDQVGEDDERT